MAEHSPIGWTDATWPIVAGCDYESPGCSNCWAVRDSWRLAHSPHPHIRQAFEGVVRKTYEGKLVWTGTVRPLPERLDWPLKWRTPKKIFVCSQADLFHPAVPAAFIDSVFAVMAFTPHHTHQVLTKHARRMREYLEGCGPRVSALLLKWGDRGGRWWPFEGVKTLDWEEVNRAAVAALQPLPNVWIGVTVEDNPRALERMPELMRARAAIRWVSYEPALELVDFHLPPQAWPNPVWEPNLIVFGGESAQTRATTRECDIEWARATLKECRRAGVAFFMKQLGSKPIGAHRIDLALPPMPAGKSSRYKWHEPQFWPEDLRVQEFP